MSSVLSNANAIPLAEPIARSNARAQRLDPRYWIGLGLCLLGGLALWVDLPISQSLHTRQLLKVLHQPLQVAGMEMRSLMLS